MYSLQDLDWEDVLATEGRNELFHLRDDPRETRNLEAEGRPEAAPLAARIQELGGTRATRGGRPYDPRRRDSLRGAAPRVLGYVVVRARASAPDARSGSSAGTQSACDLHATRITGRCRGLKGSLPGGRCMGHLAGDPPMQQTALSRELLQLSSASHARDHLMSRTRCARAARRSRDARPASTRVRSPADQPSPPASRPSAFRTRSASTRIRSNASSGISFTSSRSRSPSSTSTRTGPAAAIVAPPAGAVEDGHLAEVGARAEPVEQHLAGRARAAQHVDAPFDQQIQVVAGARARAGLPCPARTRRRAGTRSTACRRSRLMRENSETWRSESRRSIGGFSASVRAHANRIHGDDSDAARVIASAASRGNMPTSAAPRSSPRPASARAAARDAATPRDPRAARAPRARPRMRPGAPRSERSALRTTRSSSSRASARHASRNARANASPPAAATKTGTPAVANTRAHRNACTASRTRTT